VVTETVTSLLHWPST